MYDKASLVPEVIAEPATYPGTTDATNTVRNLSFAAWPAGASTVCCSER